MSLFLSLCLYSTLSLFLFVFHSLFLSLSVYFNLSHDTLSFSHSFCFISRNEYAKVLLSLANPNPKYFACLDALLSVCLCPWQAKQSQVGAIQWRLGQVWSIEERERQTRKRREEKRVTKQTTKKRTNNLIHFLWRNIHNIIAQNKLEICFLIRRRHKNNLKDLFCTDIFSNDITN